MGKPGPRGSRYRRARNAVLAQSTICHLCGHADADQVDHVRPRSLNPELDDADHTNLAPAHGVNGCPTCGEKCNQAKGNRTVSKPVRSRNW
ncbi:HNH endonuclease [Catenuloplanes atrovinosus]|uniref:5-methylcytosine-specific restriction endonuclease McrA n=1 Tax=Catenuloplanes atrovinosus TaxID=137266 RepID=A0AAE4CC92_9ACTN|nr:HNH endonuclease [Catenuloplanes atrovinosus]MDR7278923.1 5-methylcytosine-specific restriction endonuclease McrA [Catenuloplanes atrovinosus]